MPSRHVVHHTPDPDARPQAPSTGEVYAPHHIDEGTGESDLGAFQGLVAMRPSAYTQLREALEGMVGGWDIEQQQGSSSVDEVLTAQARDVTVVVLDRVGSVERVSGGHVAGRDTAPWVGKHFSAVIGASSRVTGPIQDALAGRPACVSFPSALVGPEIAKPGTTVMGMCIPRQEGAHRAAAGAVVLLMSVLTAL